MENFRLKNQQAKYYNFVNNFAFKCKQKLIYEFIGRDTHCMDLLIIFLNKFLAWIQIHFVLKMWKSSWSNDCVHMHNVGVMYVDGSNYISTLSLKIHSRKSQKFRKNDFYLKNSESWMLMFNIYIVNANIYKFGTCLRFYKFFLQIRSHFIPFLTV